MASASQTLEERCEFRRRSPLPRRELVRCHEERREVRLTLNRRKESSGLRMRPLARGHLANEGDIVEKSEPQGTDGIAVCFAGLDEPFAVSMGHEGQGWRRLPVDDPDHPQEMFRRKGQDWSNRLARVRGTKGTISEEDPKSNLLSLWAPPRASAVPPDTGLRVGSSEDRGVGRGDTETGPDRGFLEKRGEEGRRRAKWIDVDEIVPVGSDMGYEVLGGDIGIDAIPPEVFPNHSSREAGSIVEGDAIDSRLQSHPDSPRTAGGKAIEGRAKPPGPFGQDHRGEVPIHPHRRIVERPRSRGARTFSARELGDLEARRAFVHFLDREGQIHGRSDASAG